MRILVVLGLPAMSFVQLLAFSHVYAPTSFALIILFFPLFEDPSPALRLLVRVNP